MASNNTTIGINVKQTGAKRTTKDVQALGAALNKVGVNTKQVGVEAERSARSTTRLGQASASSSRQFAAQASGLGGLVSAYAGAAATVFALQQAFSALNRAAQVETLIKGTQNLASAVGENGNRVISTLKEITQNQITMSEAAEKANLALSSGFNSDQIERLGAISLRASKALGRNLGDAFERLVRGSAKLEPELLDELGIFTRLDPAAEAYARQIGKAASSLTQFERRQAFVNAVIEEGERKFKAINVSLPSSQKSLEQVSTAFIELAQQAGIFLANILTPLLDSVKDGTGLLSLFSIALLQISRVAIRELSTTLGGGVERINAWSKQLVASSKETQGLQENLAILNKTTQEQSRIFYRGKEDARKQASEFYKLGKAGALTKEQLEDFTRVQRDQLLLAQSSQREARKQLAALEATGSSTKNYENRVKALNATITQTSADIGVLTTNVTQGERAIKNINPLIRAQQKVLTGLGMAAQFAGTAIGLMFKGLNVVLLTTALFPLIESIPVIGELFTDAKKSVVGFFKEATAGTDQFKKGLEALVSNDSFKTLKETFTAEGFSSSAIGKAQDEVTKTVLNSVGLIEKGYNSFFAMFGEGIDAILPKGSAIEAWNRRIQQSWENAAKDANISVKNIKERIQELKEELTKTPDFNLANNLELQIRLLEKVINNLAGTSDKLSIIGKYAELTGKASEEIERLSRVEGGNLFIAGQLVAVRDKLNGTYKETSSAADDLIAAQAILAAQLETQKRLKEDILTTDKTLIANVQATITAQKNVNKEIETAENRLKRLKTQQENTNSSLEAAKKALKRYDDQISANAKNLSKVQSGRRTGGWTTQIAEIRKNTEETKALREEEEKRITSLTNLSKRQESGVKALQKSINTAKEYVNSQEKVIEAEKKFSKELAERNAYFEAYQKASARLIESTGALKIALEGTFSQEGAFAVNNYVKSFNQLSALSKNMSADLASIETIRTSFNTDDKSLKDQAKDIEDQIELRQKLGEYDEATSKTMRETLRKGIEAETKYQGAVKATVLQILEKIPAIRNLTRTTEKYLISLSREIELIKARQDIKYFDLETQEKQKAFEISQKELELQQRIAAIRAKTSDAIKQATIDRIELSNKEFEASQKILDLESKRAQMQISGDIAGIQAEQKIFSTLSDTFALGLDPDLKNLLVTLIDNDFTLQIEDKKAEGIALKEKDIARLERANEDRYQQELALISKKSALDLEILNREEKLALNQITQQENALNQERLMLNRQIERADLEKEIQVTAIKNSIEDKKAQAAATKGNLTAALTYLVGSAKFVASYQEKNNTFLKGQSDIFTTFLQALGGIVENIPGVTGVATPLITPTLTEIKPDDIQNTKSRLENAIAEFDKVPGKLDALSKQQQSDLDILNNKQEQIIEAQKDSLSVQLSGLNTLRKETRAYYSTLRRNLEATKSGEETLAKIRRDAAKGDLDLERKSLGQAREAVESAKNLINTKNAKELFTFVGNIFKFDTEEDKLKGLEKAQNDLNKATSDYIEKVKVYEEIQTELNETVDKGLDILKERRDLELEMVGINKQGIAAADSYFRLQDEFLSKTANLSNINELIGEKMDQADQAKVAMANSLDRMTDAQNQLTLVYEDFKQFQEGWVGALELGVRQLGDVLTRAVAEKGAKGSKSGGGLFAQLGGAAAGLAGGIGVAGAKILEFFAGINFSGGSKKGYSAKVESSLDAQIMEEFEDGLNQRMNEVSQVVVLPQAESTVSGIEKVATAIAGLPVAALGGTIGAVSSLFGLPVKNLKGLNTQLGGVTTALGHFSTGLQWAGKYFGDAKEGWLTAFGGAGGVAGGALGAAAGVAVGEMVGGVIGQFMGPLGGFIGSALGGLAGGFIGKLFGGKRSNNVGYANYDVAQGKIVSQGNEGSYENQKGAVSIAQGLGELTGIVEGLVGSASNLSSYGINVGSRDPARITTVGNTKREIYFGNDISAEELQKNMLIAVLEGFKNRIDIDANVKRYIDVIYKETDDVEKALENIKFAKGYSEIIDEFKVVQDGVISATENISAQVRNIATGLAAQINSIRDKAVEVFGATSDQIKEFDSLKINVFLAEFGLNLDAASGKVKLLSNGLEGLSNVELIFANIDAEMEGLKDGLMALGKSSAEADSIIEQGAALRKRIIADEFNQSIRYADMLSKGIDVGAIQNYEKIFDYQNNIIRDAKSIAREFANVTEYRDLVARTEETVRQQRLDMIAAANEEELRALRLLTQAGAEYSDAFMKAAIDAEVASRKISGMFEGMLSLVDASRAAQTARRGYASGGFVDGPSSNKDTVPAMLMPGEYVLNKESAGKIGYDVLDALNSGKYKAYATGGEVRTPTQVQTGIGSPFAIPAAEYGAYQKYGADTDITLSFREAASIVTDLNEDLFKSYTTLQSRAASAAQVTDKFAGAFARVSQEMADGNVLMAAAIFELSTGLISAKNETEAYNKIVARSRASTLLNAAGIVKGRNEVSAFTTELENFFFATQTSSTEYSDLYKTINELNKLVATEVITTQEYSSALNSLNSAYNESIQSIQNYTNFFVELNDSLDTTGAESNIRSLVYAFEDSMDQITYAVEDGFIDTAQAAIEQANVQKAYNAARIDFFKEAEEAQLKAARDSQNKIVDVTYKTAAQVELLARQLEAASKSFGSFEAELVSFFNSTLSVTERVTVGLKQSIESVLNEAGVALQDVSQDFLGTVGSFITYAQNGTAGIAQLEQALGELNYQLQVSEAIDIETYQLGVDILSTSFMDFLDTFKELKSALDDAKSSMDDFANSLLDSMKSLEDEVEALFREMVSNYRSGLESLQNMYNTALDNQANAEEALYNTLFSAQQAFASAGGDLEGHVATIKRIIEGPDGYAGLNTYLTQLRLDIENGVASIATIDTETPVAILQQDLSDRLAKLNTLKALPDSADKFVRISRLLSEITDIQSQLNSATNASDALKNAALDLVDVELELNKNNLDAKYKNINLTLTEITDNLVQRAIDARQIFNDTNDIVDQIKTALNSSSLGLLLDSIDPDPVMEFTNQLSALETEFANIQSAIGAINNAGFGAILNGFVNLTDPNTIAPITQAAGDAYAELLNRLKEYQDIIDAKDAYEALYGTIVATTPKLPIDEFTDLNKILVDAQTKMQTFMTTIGATSFDDLDTAFREFIENAISLLASPLTLDLTNVVSTALLSNQTLVASQSGTSSMGTSQAQSIPNLLNRILTQGLGVQSPGYLYYVAAYLFDIRDILSNLAGSLVEGFTSTFSEEGKVAEVVAATIAATTSTTGTGSSPAIPGLLGLSGQIFSVADPISKPADYFYIITPRVVTVDEFFLYTEIPITDVVNFIPAELYGLDREGEPGLVALTPSAATFEEFFEVALAEIDYTTFFDLSTVEVTFDTFMTIDKLNHSWKNWWDPATIEETNYEDWFKILQRDLAASDIFNTDAKENISDYISPEKVTWENLFSLIASPVDFSTLFSLEAPKKITYDQAISIEDPKFSTKLTDWVNINKQTLNATDFFEVSTIDTADLFSVTQQALEGSAFYSVTKSDLAATEIFTFNVDAKQVIDAKDLFEVGQKAPIEVSDVFATEISGLAENVLSLNDKLPTNIWARFKTDIMGNASFSAYLKSDNEYLKSIAKDASNMATYLKNIMDASIVVEEKTDPTTGKTTVTIEDSLLKQANTQTDYLKDIKASSDYSKKMYELMVYTDDANNVLSLFQQMSTRLGSIVTYTKNISTYTDGLKDLLKTDGTSISDMVKTLKDDMVAHSKAWTDTYDPVLDGIDSNTYNTYEISRKRFKYAGAEDATLSLATGGPVRGPGTGTSDSIPAMLSNGEYVINAQSAKSIGKVTLDAMNSQGLGGLSSLGRRGDSMLAHINPIEAMMLKSMGGSGTRNPLTGLFEYFFDDYPGKAKPNFASYKTAANTKWNTLADYRDGEGWVSLLYRESINPGDVGNLAAAEAIGNAYIAARMEKYGWSPAEGLTWKDVSKYIFDDLRVYFDHNAWGDNNHVNVSAFGYEDNDGFTGTFSMNQKGFDSLYNSLFNSMYAGGLVTGPGTSISDSIPAMLSRGEYVVKKSSVDNIGKNTLDYMNETGNAPKGDVEINITNNGQPVDIEGQPTVSMQNGKVVVDVVLKDLRTNGPIARSVKRMR